MRIVLTNIGKEEINNNQEDEKLILNTDNNMPELNSHLINLKNKIKFDYFIPKSKSLNKYKNNVIITANEKYNKNKINNIKNRNQNNIFKSNLYSIQRNYIPKNYIDPFNGLYKINNRRNNLPLKLITLNESVFSLPIEAQKLYIKEENKDKSELKVINKENNIIKDENNNNDNSYSSLKSKSISLPKIELKNGLSLKILLNSKNKKNLDDNILKKEINKSDSNLINYLQLDKCIQPSFVKKINKANDVKLYKLDKICQKYFEKEKDEIILKNNIQNRIKKVFSKDAEYCKKRLRNMNNALKGIEHIYKEYEIKMDDLKDKKINYFKEFNNKNIKK